MRAAKNPPPSTIRSAAGPPRGVLNPGEKVRIPIYYIGQEQPYDLTQNSVTFSVESLTLAGSTLQRVSDQRNGIAPDAHHLSQGLLCQRQDFAVGQIPGPQQPARQPRLDRMQRIAEQGLLRTREQRLLMPDHQVAERRVGRLILL